MKSLLAIVLLILLTCWGIIPVQWFTILSIILVIGGIDECRQGNRRGYQPRVKVDYSRIQFPMKSYAVYPQKAPCNKEQEQEQEV